MGCKTLNNYTMAVEMNLNEPVVVKKNNAVLVEGVNYNVTTTANSIKVQGLEDYINRGQIQYNGNSYTLYTGRVLQKHTQ
ncbi:hypothetical protein R83H12_01609 [Fibrobacteria bacterium R8-3-H12]